MDEGKEEDSQEADSQSIDVEEEADPEEPPISSLEAAKAMDIVRRFTEKNFADPNILKLSDGLEEAIYQFREKNRTQKKLTDFFQSTN